MMSFCILRDAEFIYLMLCAGFALLLLRPFVLLFLLFHPPSPTSPLPDTTHYPTHHMTSVSSLIISYILNVPACRFLCLFVFPISRVFFSKAFGKISGGVGELLGVSLGRLCPWERRVILAVFGSVPGLS